VRTGILLGYPGGFAEAVDHVADLENAGVLDLVLVPEAYSYDAVSQLGYLAAKTSTIELGSGVMPIYTRTPRPIEAAPLTSTDIRHSATRARISLRGLTLRTGQLK
jgi:Luciferase-like monooxygenase